MTLTKANIISQILTSNPNLTKKQAHKAVETILETIKTSLGSGENVLLSGFGKFIVNAKSTRKGRNPKTGESMIIAARKVVVFKPSGKLREIVNKVD